MTDTRLDLDFVRSQFPASRWEWAFFENAGGAFVPSSVIQRMGSYMSETQVQPGYPASPSMDALARMEEGHNRMAQFIGVEPDLITISASTSINIYVLAQALLPLWQAGDEIVVSSLNHEANSGPWRRLSAQGLKIVEWRADPVTALHNTESLAPLLNERTRLVALPHVSNITGCINDIASITRMAHNVGVKVCVDGVAYAPHRALELDEWDVDFYAFSFYKVFGPHLGCLYGKRESLLELRGQYHYFFPEDDLLHKLNPAGPNHESIAALAGIADYFDALANHHFTSAPATFPERVQAVYGLISQHEFNLAERLLDYLDSRKDIHLLGVSNASESLRVPTFSFTIEGANSAEIPAIVAQRRIAIGSGHFYAKRLLDSLKPALGEKGVVRCSMAHYNTMQEVDSLIEALEYIA